MSENKGTAFFASYKHDDLEHDKTGPYMMATGLSCSPATRYRFSASSAQMITDNLNFDRVDVDPDEYGNALRQADFLYDREQANLMALVPNPVDEN